MTAVTHDPHDELELDALAGDRPPVVPDTVRTGDDDLVWSPDATLNPDGSKHDGRWTV
jgi:hypothetical protein